MSREAAETASSSSSSSSLSVPAQPPGSFTLVAESKLPISEAVIVRLEAENAKLKADLIRLEQRMEYLEKRLEKMEGRRRQKKKKLEVTPIPVQGGFFGSSASSPSSSPAILMQPSSPLAPTILGNREVKADIKEVEQVLQHVAYGEQEEAESLIRKKPELLLCKGSVTDLSKREFHDITAFQYALWAMDWHMWTMIKKYLPSEEAYHQMQALQLEGTAYTRVGVKKREVHFDLKPLITALQTYADKAERVWNYDKRAQDHWCKVVGAEQALLPAHVVNEYCRPDRSFDPVPTFTEATLPRIRAVYVNKPGEEWFSVYCNHGKIGETFACVRGGWGRDHVWGAGASSVSGVWVGSDLASLQSLSGVRFQQLERLSYSLKQKPLITEALQSAGLFSDGIRLVLDYVGPTDDDILSENHSLK